MHRRGAARRLAIVREVWRELPRYGQRHLLYLIHSERDAGWGDLPRVVPLRADGGLSIEIVPRDAIGGFIYRYGLWDLLGTKFFLAYLRPGMVVLDLSERTSATSTSWPPRGSAAAASWESFEPHPAIRARLERSIAAATALGNVVVRPEAVTCSPRRGSVLLLSRNADNQGTSSTLEGSSAPEELREAEPLLVPATSLDEIAAALRRPLDLIKLDVEGGEYRALEGGTETPPLGGRCSCSSCSSRTRSPLPRRCSRASGSPSRASATTGAVASGSTTRPRAAA